MFLLRYENLLDVATSVSFKRIDEHLLDLLGKKASYSGDNIIVITHQQLAEELVTAREVVSRMLKHLESNSIIEMNRNRIKLL
ncbi:helix-turn-helix domain-containing protein [Elizabethkingia anophelis]|uniref:helix-turn-helix domain-containing protein n=1 Tax=Elizabethkingia anophelis TaxID=1117645 RepID=UPI0035CED0BC